MLDGGGFNRGRVKSNHWNEGQKLQFVLACVRWVLWWNAERCWISEGKEQGRDRNCKQKFEREADVDEEDDEEELKENEDRLALQNYYEDDDEESVMLEIKEQKIDLTNVKHLHQSEFIYIVHHYNVWRLGPEIRKRLVDFIKYKSLEFINIASEDLKLFADLLN